jgi:hypothetical protein
LQASDQVVGLAGAFGKVFDLLVLDADLLLEKRVFTFEALDIGCRDQSRQVGAGRRLLLRVATGRGMSRLKGMRSPVRKEKVFGLKLASALDY